MNLASEKKIQNLAYAALAAFVISCSETDDNRTGLSTGDSVTISGELSMPESGITLIDELAVSFHSMEVNFTTCGSIKKTYTVKTFTEVFSSSTCSGSDYQISWVKLGETGNTQITQGENKKINGLYYHLLDKALVETNSSDQQAAKNIAYQYNKTTPQSAPGPFNLISQKLNVSDAGGPEVSWSESKDATSYDVAVSMSIDCSNPIEQKNVTENVVRISKQSAGNYYLCVTAKNSKGSKAATNNPLNLIVVPKSTKSVCTGGTLCTQMKSLFEQGLLAGNEGDYYHNLDGGHSTVGTSSYPQVHVLPGVRSGSLMWSADYEGKVVIRNASLAYTAGDYWASIARAQSMSNSYEMQGELIYGKSVHTVFPEHLDHDAVDYFHAPNVYWSVSQGSSWSDQSTVTTFFHVLRSFRPEVKSVLKEKGLLIAAIQSLIRRAYAGSEADYLTGKGHPAVFSISHNDTWSNTLHNMANEITIDKIPPTAYLSVVNETFANFAIDGKYRSEKFLAERKHFVSRLWYSNAYTQKITLDANTSFDLNGRNLTYHWKVLRGDPAHVRIIPKNANSSIVEIEVDYHAEAQVPSPNIKSNAVYVGLFVHNGYYYSMPAYFNTYTMRNETRTYSGGVLTNKVINSNYVYPTFK